MTQTIGPHIKQNLYNCIYFLYTSVLYVFSQRASVFRRLYDLAIDALLKIENGAYFSFDKFEDNYTRKLFWL